MRSLTSLPESRAYGPHNCRTSAENDLCNKICQKRSFPFAPLRDWCSVTTELPSAGRADLSAKGERAALVLSAGSHSEHCVGPVLRVPSPVATSGPRMPQCFGRN